MPSIEFTGSNTAEVRDFVNADGGVDSERETWFMTKGMGTGTGNQAWNYARGEQHWSGDVKAAVYDPRTGVWAPVRIGDVIEHQGSGYGVRSGL